MAIEIITGVGSAAHVSSTDQQAINQGMVGAGSYVFHVGNKLAAVITSNNLITIKDGVFCVGGIMGRIPSGASDGIEIENGTSGVNRTDLIVLEYRKTSGIETIEWKVLKGTTEYHSGNTLNGDTMIQFPMYRVDIAGLSISSVKALYTYSNSLGGTSANSGKTTVTFTDNTAPTKKELKMNLAKANGLITASVNNVFNLMQAKKTVILSGKLPEEFRPERTIGTACAFVNNHVITGSARFAVEPDGSIKYVSNATGWQEVYFTMSWPEKE